MCENTTPARCRWMFWCSTPRARMTSFADFRRSKSPKTPVGPTPVETVEQRGRYLASLLLRR